MHLAHYTVFSALELARRMAECIEMAPCPAECVMVKFFTRPGEMAVALAETALSDGSKVYDLHVFHAE